MKRRSQITPTNEPQPTTFKTLQKTDSTQAISKGSKRSNKSLNKSKKNRLRRCGSLPEIGAIPDFLAAGGAGNPRLKRSSSLPIELSGPSGDRRCRCLRSATSGILWLLLILTCGCILFLFAHQPSRQVFIHTINLAFEAVASTREPVRFLFYLFILFSHQLFGIPFQWLSEMFISHSTKSFSYAYFLSLGVNLTSAAFVANLTRRCYKKYFSRKYGLHKTILLLNSEAKASPVQLSILMRLTYLSSLYKNLLLSMSGIKLVWYFLPILADGLLLNIAHIYLALNMQEVFSIFDPSAIARIEKNRKAAFAFTWMIFCSKLLMFIFAVSWYLLKNKKARSLKERKMRETISTRENSRSTSHRRKKYISHGELSESSVDFNPAHPSKSQQRGSIEFSRLKDAIRRIEKIATRRKSSKW